MSCCPGCHGSADESVEGGTPTQLGRNGEYLKEHVTSKVNLESKE